MLTADLSSVDVDDGALPGTHLRGREFVGLQDRYDLADARCTLEAEPGQTLLVLRTRIENLSDTPIGVGSTADLTKANLVNTDRPLIDLVGVTAVDRTAVWRPDGSSGQVFLQPGVPAEVMLAWTIPDDALAGREVSLDVHDAEVSVGAVILSSNVVTWRAGDVVARITVPVEDGA